MNKLIGLLAGTALCVVAAVPASANLLTNPSFETGDLTGWTNTGNLGFTSVCSGGCSGYGEHDGAFAVFEGPVGSDGFLSQTFADSPGAHYLVSGWLAGNGTGTSDWGMQINGVDHVVVGSPVPSQAYTNYTFFFTGSGSDTFTVRFRNDPSFDAFDDFSIVGVPEPATLALFGAGLAGLGAMRRRRKAKA